MDITLDRSRKYATVHGERIQGDADTGVYFKQDGLAFDAKGILIDAKVPEHLKKDVEARRAKIKDVVATKPDDDENDTAGEIQITSADEVNLELWLRQNVKYPWHKVTDAIRTRYSATKPSKQAAVEFLVADIKLVPFAEVHPELRKFLGS